MRKRTLSLMLLTSIFISCEDTLEPEINGVEFTSSISSATNTKVVSDAFEQADEILVSAFDGATEYAKDVSYLYNNSLFTSGSPILYQNETQMLTFLAVYPAINNFSSSFDFLVSADQTVEGSYEMSDLLMSKTEPTTDNCPQLSFDHKMNSIILNITSASTTGGTMTINSKNQVTCDILGNSFTAFGESVVITPAINDDLGYKAIIAPQTITGGTPFAIYEFNGMTYTCNTSEKNDHSFMRQSPQTQ